MDKINELRNYCSFTKYNNVKERDNLSYPDYNQDVISSEFEGDFYKTIGFDTVRLTRRIGLRGLDISKLNASQTIIDQLEAIDKLNMENAEKENLRNLIITNAHWHYNDDILHLGIMHMNGGHYIKIEFSSKIINKYGLIKDLKEVHDMLDERLKYVFNKDMDLKSFNISRLDISADIETNYNFNELFPYLDNLKIPRLDNEHHGTSDSKSIYYKNGSEEVNIYDKKLALKERDKINISKKITRVERRRFKNIKNTYGVKTFGELIEHQENVKDEFRLWLKEIYEDNKHTFLVKKDSNSIMRNAGSLTDKELTDIIFINDILNYGINKYLKSKSKNVRSKYKQRLKKKIQKYNDFFDKQNGLIQDIEKIFL